MSAFLYQHFYVSIFIEILEKRRDYPPFFFLDSNSPCKDRLFLRYPSLGQKPLCLVGTVLKVSANIYSTQPDPRKKNDSFLCRKSF